MQKTFGFGTSLFIIALWLLSIACPVEARANKIEIHAEPGVPDEAKASAQLAVDNSLRFFKETFNLELKKDVRIIIVPTPETYAAILVREAQVNQKEAERQARTTFGWSIGENVIVQNIGAPFNPNARRRIYNMSHEIVHKFQVQECPDKPSRVMWIYEGVAGIFAARIVELSGGRPLAQQKESWLQETRKLRGQPELKELKSQSDWYKGLDKYGTDPTYSFAGLAVLKLIEEKGYESVFVYFRKLNDGSPEDSFKNAFGMDLKGFDKGFNTSLGKERGKTGK